VTARDITFESGYRRLQEIAERLNSDEVPVHEMCDLFAEGTGLHQALSGYLRDQRARVEAIERGEGVQAFRIVPPEGAGVERGIDAAPRAGAASGRPPADGAPPAAAPPSRSDELEFP
jgi:exodeoxyribonuclease VII small subunit